jgi:hypothetical protein
MTVNMKLTFALYPLQELCISVAAADRRKSVTAVWILDLSSFAKNMRLAACKMTAFRRLMPACCRSFLPLTNDWILIADNSNIMKSVFAL